MKFEYEVPDEQRKEGKHVIRDQGAARAISVSNVHLESQTTLI